MVGRATSAVVWGLAVLAVPAAVVLSVLALDVYRSPAQLTMDDGRFQAAPRLQGGTVTLTLDPKSVTVIALAP